MQLSKDQVLIGQLQQLYQMLILYLEALVQLPKNSIKEQEIFLKTNLKTLLKKVI